MRRLRWALGATKGAELTKSELQEALAALYLRLNGYFVSGFIAHAPTGNRTEIDILAVRFPGQREPEREIGLCKVLGPSPKYVEFVVGEVKGGSKHPQFNANFRERPEAIRSVLNRFGAMREDEVDALLEKIRDLLEPQAVIRSQTFPQIDTSAGLLRFILFAPEQTRPKADGSLIYGDDMIQYIWECMRPDERRADCATNYNRTLWGHQFNPLVAYFKDPGRKNPGSIAELCKHVGV